MTVDRSTLRRLLVGTDVLVVTLALVLPVAVAAVETRLATPLALPGYLLLTLGSAVGSHLFPAYALWLFWVPFVLGSYALAVCSTLVWRSVRDRVGAGD